MIFVESTMIMLLLFKSPLRKLVIAILDKIKRGRGPIVVKTVSATISVVFLSTLYSILKIQRRGIGEDGAPDTLSPTDQILFSKHLLEASLMGILFHPINFFGLVLILKFVLHFDKAIGNFFNFK